MDAIPAATIVIPTALKAHSSLQQAKYADDAAKFESSQMTAAGNAEFAAATRDSYEEARRGKILEENATAAMAAGGGTTTDAGAIKALAEIERDTKYNSMAALFEGKSKRQDLLRQAAARRIQGDYDRRTHKYNAVSTILEGGSKLYMLHDSYKDEEEPKVEKPRRRQGRSMGYRKTHRKKD